MRARVDDGSNIRVVFADPGIGGGKAAVKVPSAGVTPPPSEKNNYTPLATPVVPGGSLGLNSDSTSYMTAPASIDFLFDGNFTIEWWHKRTDSNPFPRVFAMGTYPTTSLGVSLEGGTFYFWTPGGPLALGGYAANGAWGHYAVVRSGSTVTLYRDGLATGTASYSGAVGSSTVNLTVGNEETRTANAAFGGRITNLHMVNGTAKYSSNFSAPTGPTPGIGGVNGTKLLLWMTDAGSTTLDGSGSGRTIMGGNNFFSPETPFA